MNTKTKGERTEGIVIAALLKMGKKILIPFGENSRYDVVVEDANGFSRIQCKTGRLHGSYISFNSCSTGNVRNFDRKNYRGQVEFFGVYCPQNDNVYLVPVMKANKTETHLVVSASNRCAPTVKLWAKNFKI